MTEDQTPAPALDPNERDLEAPDADAYEQALTADPADEPERAADVHIVNPYVDEYDALEQAQVVELDDDYR